MLRPCSVYSAPTPHHIIFWPPINLMKQSLFLFVLILFCLPPLRGQTFVLNNPPFPEVTSVWSNGSYQPLYRTGRGLNKKMMWGGIIAASGAVVSFTGVIFYSYIGYADGTSIRPTNMKNVNTGKGLLIAGGAISATGLVLMIAGKIEKNRSYGLELVAPANNELGIAYNF